MSTQRFTIDPRPWWNPNTDRWFKVVEDNKTPMGFRVVEIDNPDEPKPTGVQENEFGVESP